jgi:hypothetical protein
MVTFVLNLLTPVLSLGELHILQGRPASKGHLVTRITVTLSIFNFRTWFFAQIVENRETQLSSHFSGPGDIFSKSYDENRFVWQRMASEILRFAHQIVRARFSAGALRPNLVFVITFRKVVPRTWKVARKLRLAILYNLREKSSPKIKNWQSYSNPRDLIPPFERSSPVCTYCSTSRGTCTLISADCAVASAQIARRGRIENARSSTFHIFDALPRWWPREVKPFSHDPHHKRLSNGSDWSILDRPLPSPPP